MCEREERDFGALAGLQSAVNPALIKSITNPREKGPREKWKEWEGQVVIFQDMKFWAFYNKTHYKLTRKDTKC